jgi:hypothetical protein
MAMSWFHRSDGNEPWQKLLKDHKPVEAIDEDSGEVIDIKPEQDSPNDVDGLLIGFSYLDNAGQATARVVLCYHCWHANELTYVQGFCMLRKALRTFRADRMSELREVRTGRKITDPIGFFAHFTDAPPARWQPKAKVADTVTTWQAPTEAERAADTAYWHRRYEARRLCIDGLRVLAYTALSDGATTEAERNIEESYVESRLAMGSFEQTQEMTDAMMQIGAGLAVPFSSLIRSINVIAPVKEHYELVLECMVDMIAVDGEADRIQSEAYHRLLAAHLAAERQ